jgi:hypothetical protein
MRPRIAEGREGWKLSSARLIVELEVEGHDDPVALEQAIVNEGRRAARDLYRAAVEDADRSAVEASGGTRQRVEERWIATLMGRVRIGRYRVRVGNRTLHPLDGMLDLRAGEPSPAVRSLVKRLSDRFSSRQIAEILGEITGATFSRHIVLRIFEEDGLR